MQEWRVFAQLAIEDGLVFRQVLQQGLIHSSEGGEACILQGFGWEAIK